MIPPMKLSAPDTLAAYVRAFEALRAEHVVPFYSLPCTFIRPDGVWIVQDQATALVLVNHLIDHARTQRYHHTEVSQLTRRNLASSLTELSGDFERFDPNGSLIARFGFTYLLREVGDEWKIIVAIAHDPGTMTGQP